MVSAIGGLPETRVSCRPGAVVEATGGVYRYAYTEGQTLASQFNSVSPNFALRER
jgi:hypothetical protein